MTIVNTIILVILALIIIYILARFIMKSNIIYDGVYNASDTNSYTTRGDNTNYDGINKNMLWSNDVDINESNNFMFSLWFAIDNWSYNVGHEKNILFLAFDNDSNTQAITAPGLENTTSLSRRKTGLDNNSKRYKNFNIALDKYENNLLIDIETVMTRSEGTVSSSDFTRYVIKNIPIQKWNCLTISVDNRTMDVYLDGKLRNSFILHNVYQRKIGGSVKKNIYLGEVGSNIKGFKGYIHRIRYESTSINSQQAYDIYREGVSGNVANDLMGGHRVEVQLYEYNKKKGKPFVF
tara:strand:- start:72 stop:950 length:879 start_codon:yes stop_codon:yes gene_type:complete